MHQEIAMKPSGYQKWRFARVEEGWDAYAAGKPRTSPYRGGDFRDLWELGYDAAERARREDEARVAALHSELDRVGN